MRQPPTRSRKTGCFEPLRRATSPRPASAKVSTASLIRFRVGRSSFETALRARGLHATFQVTGFARAGAWPLRWTQSGLPANRVRRPRGRRFRLPSRARHPRERSRVLLLPDRLSPGEETRDSAGLHGPRTPGGLRRAGGVVPSSSYRKSTPLGGRLQRRLSGGFATWGDAGATRNWPAEARSSKMRVNLGNQEAVNTLPHQSARFARCRWAASRSAPK